MEKFATCHFPSVVCHFLPIFNPLKQEWRSNQLKKKGDKINSTENVAERGVWQEKKTIHNFSSLSKKKSTAEKSSASDGG